MASSPYYHRSHEDDEGKVQVLPRVNNLNRETVRAAQRAALTVSLVAS